MIGYLTIDRASRIRNTKIKVLTQGDNQIVCTLFKKKETRTEGELREELNNMFTNNWIIMEEIENRSADLGLIIKPEETMVSADLLIYGKLPIFRVLMSGLGTKRWSRISCTSNDHNHIPSLASSLSSVNTAALTVSHFSNTPEESMRLHCFFSSFVRRMVHD